MNNSDKPLIDISVKSWARFSTPEFAVKSVLMGTFHEFIFDSYKVKVILPRKEQANKVPGEDIAVSNGWPAGKTKQDAHEFKIYAVDIEIDIDEKVSVPPSVIESKAYDGRVFECDQNNKALVTTIAKKYADISERVFYYWLDMLRWSINNTLFTKQYDSYEIFRQGFYLKDKKTGHNVFTPTSIYLVERVISVTDDQWVSIQNKLTNKLDLPIYWKFKLDAQLSMRICNYERAIIELAMACETYLRHSYFDYLPKDQLHDELIEYIENANIHQFYSKFFKWIVKTRSDYDKNLIKDMDSLMAQRNSYVHMGNMKDANYDRCNRYLNAVEKLFTIEKLDK